MAKYYSYTRTTGLYSWAQLDKSNATHDAIRVNFFIILILNCKVTHNLLIIKRKEKDIEEEKELEEQKRAEGFKEMNIRDIMRKNSTNGYNAVG